MSGIQTILNAEKKAEEVVAQAKRNRLDKLRKAKESAETQMSIFRAEQESKFQSECGAKSAADPHMENRAATQAAVALVDQDYTKNKIRTVDYVMKKVIDVPITLTSTQKQALVAGMV
eukprot:TRINITY_DN7021_c0_g1_i2.p1 TRINITY_DN7021_c0_g1~~TRINITY_DN7021_c0_g1_i2.p1  ORF type:complete len:118 (-),score=49.72 TRINITY_DN7021_c0_g1_i2:242-595(-)